MLYAAFMTLTTQALVAVFDRSILAMTSSGLCIVMMGITWLEKVKLTTATTDPVVLGVVDPDLDSTDGCSGA